VFLVTEPKHSIASIYNLRTTTVIYVVLIFLNFNPLKGYNATKLMNKFPDGLSADGDVWSEVCRVH